MFGSVRARGAVAAFTLIAALLLSPSAALASQPPSGALADPPVVVQQGLAVAPTLAIDPVSQLQQLQPQAGSMEPSRADSVPPKRPLRDLVISFVNYGNQDAEDLCLAKAIYFEARGESLEGRLAVAEVILNRAASGRYPTTICSVVTQPAQFSFIRRGQFPRVDADSECWRDALAIADIARKELVDQIAPNVLWYHATYVAPSWGRRLTRVARIGTHVFYS